MGIWISDGTISLVSNSKTVTGTGTAFKSGANPARVGQQLILYVGANTATYEIERVDSDSSMQIAIPWRGATVNNTPYAINTASEGSPSDLSRRAAQVMGYYQVQLDGIQKLLAGTGDVEITAPDGTPIVVPSISGLKVDIDKRVLAKGGTISNLRRVGQEHGSLISNVAYPLPNNTETTVHNGFAVSLLNGWSNTMVRFRFVIRNYANKHRNVDITFSGYVYSVTNNWVDDASESSAVGAGALDWMVYTHKKQDGTPTLYFYNKNGFDDYSTVEIFDDVSRGVVPVYSISRVSGFNGTPVKMLRHYHSGNVLGAVGLSAGVPTGSIIERGANANGEYIKFADGTMVCCVSIFNIPVTAISASFNRVCNLPAAFASIDSMRPVASVLSTNSGSLESSGALYRNGFTLAIANVSQIHFLGYTYASAIQTPLTIGMQVIGRWS